jgi:Putative Flp pilus-assembly TadE/G-like
MRTNERGAIIIHVAFALMALLCFSAIVLDQGVFFVARRQAQNAADAGALAGAITLMLDRTRTAEATTAAQDFARQNVVWGQGTANADITVSPLPFNCPDGVPSCIRVDVLRGLPNPHDGSTHTNTIPTLMMGIVNLTNQGVRATATAQIAAGNAVECIKPWAVVDRWTDNSGTGTNTSGWDQTDIFNPGVDTYTAPGFNATTDVGLQLMLKGEGKDWSSGWSMEVDLNGGNGGNVYRDEIAGCPEWVPTIGLYQPGTSCSNNPGDVDYLHGCLNVKTGVKNGPTGQGVTTLIGMDPGATWNTATNSVTGGCTTAGNCRTTNPLGIDISPRIVPIALFDPQAYSDGGFNGNGGMARVVNLLGFFVEGMCNDVYPTPPVWCGTGGDPAKTVVGRLMKYPGQSRSSSGSAGPATFLLFTRLIR